MKDKKNLLYNSLRSEDEVDFINKRNEIFMQDTTEGKVNINDYTGNDKRIVQALLENSLYSDFFELRKQIEDKIRTGTSVFGVLLENKAMVCKIYFYTKLFPFPSKRTIFYKRVLLCGR